MKKTLSVHIELGNTLLRACLAALAGGEVCWLIMQIPSPGITGLLISGGAMLLGLSAAFPFIRKELSLLIKL
jgi:hypothetical protein